MDSAESSYEEKYLEAQRTEQNVKSMEAKVKELIKLTDISSQESFYALWLVEIFMLIWFVDWPSDCPSDGLHQMSINMKTFLSFIPSSVELKQS